jgi:hypothetical protein
MRIIIALPRRKKKVLVRDWQAGWSLVGRVVLAKNLVLTFSEVAGCLFGALNETAEVITS